MKIIINKNKLINALKFCYLIGENNTSPVLLGTLLIVENDSLKIISSNGNISINILLNKAPDFNIISSGKVLVRTKTFFGIIAKLKNENIIIEKVDNSVLKIKTSTFDSNINILDEQQYPDIDFSYENWHEIKTNSIVFKKAFSKIKHAVNNNKDKSNIMSGICFSSNQQTNTLEVIGTDSYKLAYYCFYDVYKDFKIILDIDLIELILEIVKFTPEITFYISDNNIIFKLNDFIVTSKINEGTYPNTSRIITMPRENKIFISKKQLIEALDRGMVINSVDRKTTVKLTFTENKTEINFSSTEIGNCRENVECKTDIKNNETFTFLVNTHYLLAILKVFDSDEICIEFQDVLKPIAFKDPKDLNFLQLLVPIRNI